LKPKFILLRDWKGFGKMRDFAKGLKDIGPDRGTLYIYGDFINAKNLIFIMM